MADNKDFFPDNDLDGRSLLAYQWLPDKAGVLLDAGCSYGYSTKHYAQKADETYGIDINNDHIEAAKRKYPGINFYSGAIEELPFEENTFDNIIMMDVLEHTNDKIKSLSEIERVLKSGGNYIFSTPHAGKYAFLDPYNYGYNLRKNLPFIYVPLYKLVRLLKEGKLPKENHNPEHLDKHYHYTEQDYYNTLDKSSFKGKYEVVKVFKSGLYKEVTAMIYESFLHIFFSRERTRKIIGNYKQKAAQDFWIDYGDKAYNIAMMVKKK